MSKLIDDSYIDSVIKSNQGNTPNPNKTSGQDLRDLVKTLRDNIETQLTAPSTADYIIHLAGGEVVAQPRFRSGYETYTGSDASVVIQSALTAVCASGGGHLHIKGGTYTLNDELVITGWENTFPPAQQIMVTGDGYGTRIEQSTTGKNALVVKNNASIVFRNFYIKMGNNAASGILLDSTGANEISVFGGTIDEVCIYSDSISSPAFYAKNVFDLNVPHLTALSSAHHGVVMESAGATTNYGNTHFGFLRAAGSTQEPYAGVVLKSDYPYHPINQISFSNVECIQGHYGIYLSGASSNTFDHVDCEYIKYPIYIDSANTLESLANFFNGGYIYPQGTGAVGITTTAATGGNFFRLTIECDDNTIVPILDQQQYRAVNQYDVILSYFGDPTKISITDPNTLLNYRCPQNQVAVATAPTPATGNSSNQVATTAFVSGLLNNGNNAVFGDVKVKSLTAENTNGLVSMTGDATHNLIQSQLPGFTGLRPLEILASSLTFQGGPILHANNYNTYTPTLTGNGASGTWPIDIYGNAGSWGGIYGNFAQEADRVDLVLVLENGVAKYTSAYNLKQYLGLDTTNNPSGGSVSGTGLIKLVSAPTSGIFSVTGASGEQYLKIGNTSTVYTYTLPGNTFTQNSAGKMIRIKLSGTVKTANLNTYEGLFLEVNGYRVSIASFVQGSSSGTPVFQSEITMVSRASGGLFEVSIASNYYGFGSGGSANSLNLTTLDATSLTNPITFKLVYTPSAATGFDISIIPLTIEVGDLPS